MKSTRFIGTAADRNSGVYNLSEINEKIQDQTYPTNYEIENSCRFDGTSALTSPAFSSAVTTFTVSLWLKRCRLKTGTYDLEGVFTVVDNSGGTKSSYNFNNAQKLNIYDNTGSDATSTGNIIYRDLSAWYQIVIVSNSGTVSFYKNGVLDFTDDRVSTTFASTDKAVLGGYSTSSDLFAGYIADVNFIDGQALDPTHFAHEHPSTGRWSPKRYRGTYGTNGFHLEFKNTGTHTGVGGIGEDTSGNGNHWAVTGLTAHDIVPDSPGNNFVTWNPIALSGGSTTTLHTIAQGALQLTHTTDGQWQALSATFGASTGKFYYEIHAISISNTTNDHGFGFVTQEDINEKQYYGESRTVLYTLDGGNSSYSIGVGGTSDSGIGRRAVASSMPKPTNADIMQCVIDLDKRTVQFGLNGTFYETANIHFNYTTMIPVFTSYKYANNNTAADIVANFGQDPTLGGNKYPTKTYKDANNRGQFYYPPPAGALALCEKNLVQPQDSISEYRVDDTNTKALTYTGNVEISKFTPYAQDGYSIYFEGSSYLDMDANNENLSLGAGDFTLEFWVFPRPNGLRAHVFGTTGAAEITINANNTLNWLDSGVAEEEKITTSKVVDNKWNHVAISRASGVFYIYINGVKDTGYSNAADTTDYTTAPSGGGKIGSNVGGDTGTRVIGYLADFRILVGVGLYTSATIDIPTSPLTKTSTPSNCKYLLSVNQNIIKDISSNATPIAFTGNPLIDTFSPYTTKDAIPDHSVHGGSFYLDGDGDKVVLDDSDTWSVGNGDFTFKFWMYGNDNTNSTQHVFAKWNNNKEIRAFFEGSASNRYTIFWFQYNTSATPTDPWVDGGKWENLPIVPNTWNYFVLRKSGTSANNTSLYVNGSLMTPTNNTISGTVYNSADKLFIGSGGDPNSGFAGYIADFEFEKTAVSDANAAVVPTSKVSANSNTLLLLQPYHTAPAHGALETLDAYNTDETGKQLTYHGQVNVSSFSPLRGIKFGSFLSGSGAISEKRIETSAMTNFWSASGTHTFECWIYPTATQHSNGACIFGSDAYGDLDMTSANKIRVHVASSNYADSDTVLQSNEWTHIALVQTSTDRKLYINGKFSTVSGGGGTIAGNNWDISGNLQIGGKGGQGSRAPFVGYIADVRFVSAANYTGGTANGDVVFTTPSAPQTAITNTTLLLQPGKTVSNTLAAENPEKYFKTVIYDGNETDGISKNIGFQPDLLWGKGRTIAYNHVLIDSLRPHTDANSYYRLHPDTNNQQADYNDNFYITSNGFECKAAQSGVNENSYKFVMWAWRAGGAPTADYASGNDTTANGCFYKDGSAVTTSNAFSGSYTITPTRASIGTKQGFSIVKFNSGSAGDVTIPHGLNAKPDFVLLKGLDINVSWYTYHNGLSDDTKYLYLNDTFDESDLTQSTRIWGSRTFDSNVISAETGYTLDANKNYIAYCFTSIPGFSAFGSFTGNNSTDGPFVYLGFKPAFLITKLFTGTSNADYHSWVIYDNERIIHNPNHSPLYANRSHAEGKRGNTGGDSGGNILYLDFLSNGFKCRQNGTELNGNGGSNDKFIYMAFAEQPFTRNRAR